MLQTTLILALFFHAVYAGGAHNGYTPSIIKVLRSRACRDVELLFAAGEYENGVAHGLGYVGDALARGLDWKGPNRNTNYQENSDVVLAVEFLARRVAGPENVKVAESEVPAFHLQIAPRGIQRMNSVSGVRWTTRRLHWPEKFALVSVFSTWATRSRVPSRILAHHVTDPPLLFSCFYNTILQSLSVTRPLACIIAHPPSTSPALASISPASPTYNPDPEALLSPLPISTALVTILDKLEPDATLGIKRKDPKTFNPKGLLRELSIKYEEYAAATQQDAHEVLRHLIDGIMMEEVDLIKKVLQQPSQPKRISLSTRRRLTIRPSPHPGSPEGHHASLASESSVVSEPEAEADDEADVSEEEDEFEEERDASSESSSSDTSDDDEDEVKAFEKIRRKTTMRPFIDSVFGGKLGSVVICDECKNVSLTREDFMDLSLSLKDDSSKLRKRDRIRKSLQAGFFSKKSNADKATATASDSAPARPGLPRRETTSLSEAEETASGSDFESETSSSPDLERLAAATRDRSRRKSLEPGHLQPRVPGRPLWIGASTNGSGSTVSTSRSGSQVSSSSRDVSPLGRALSAMKKPSKRTPRIPKPTEEQLAYIRKVLAEVPGPAPSPLPNQLRWAQPPGTKTDQGPPTQSLAQMKLQSDDATSTDLYACLQQFTAVETLDNENSFACRNCWKLLHPDLVKRRQDQKEARRATRRARARAIRSGTTTLNGRSDEETSPTTPSGNISMRIGIPSIRATEPEGDQTPKSASPLSEHYRSIASMSNPSLLSSEGGTNESLTDDDVSSSSIAEGEDQYAGDASDASASMEGLDSGTTTPLTTANVKALAPSATTPTSSLPPPSVASSRPLSGESRSTSASKAIVTPPRKDRHILRKAHKRYLISALDLPPVLVIHFKRFMQMSKAPLFGTPFTNLKKRDDDLTFPQELDLTPFLTPAEKPPRSSGRPGRTPRRPSAPATPAATLIPSAKYRLYAVVVHIGTLAGGHYVNYVLSNRYGDRAAPGEDAEPKEGEDKESEGQERKWFYCSDDEIRVCSVEEVLRSKAYMLWVFPSETADVVQQLTFDEGTAFVVAHGSEKFKDEVLSRFFSHKNPPSFTRQLNVYNFTRLAVPELLERVSLSDGAAYNELSAWKHPKFYRDAPKVALASMSPRPAKPKLFSYPGNRQAKASHEHPVGEGEITLLAPPTPRPASKTLDLHGQLFPSPPLGLDLAASLPHFTTVSVFEFCMTDNLDSTLGSSSPSAREPLSEVGNAKEADELRQVPKKRDWRVRGRRGALGAFAELPVELLTEISRDLDHETLYALSLTSKSFRATLASPASDNLWDDARQAAGLPRLEANELSPIQYAHLVWGKGCQVCLEVLKDASGTDVQWDNQACDSKRGKVEYHLRVRLCEDCEQKLISGEDHYLFSFPTFDFSDLWSDSEDEEDGDRDDAAPRPAPEPKPDPKPKPTETLHSRAQKLCRQLVPKRPKKGSSRRSTGPQEELLWYRPHLDQTMKLLGREHPDPSTATAITFRDKRLVTLDCRAQRRSQDGQALLKWEAKKKREKAVDRRDIRSEKKAEIERRFLAAGWEESE
ncbi:hypothetical protein P7C70_g4601, partial [Phenoliferia sp. Uapishka_3]